MNFTKKPVLIAAAASLLLVQAMASRAVTYALTTPDGNDMFGNSTNTQGNLLLGEPGTGAPIPSDGNPTLVNSGNGTFGVNMFDANYYHYNPYPNQDGVYAPAFPTPGSTYVPPGNPGASPFVAFPILGDTSVTFGYLSLSGGANGQSDTFGISSPAPAAEFTFDIVDELTGVGRHFVVDGVINQEDPIGNTYITSNGISGTNAQFEAQTISVYSLSGDYGTDNYNLGVMGSNPGDLLSTSSEVTDTVGGTFQQTGSNEVVIRGVSYGVNQSISFYISQDSPISPVPLGASVGDPNFFQTVTGFVTIDVPEPGPMSIAVAMGAFSVAGLFHRLRLKRK